jgi:hypothetical protein
MANSEVTLNGKIKVRRDSESNWENENPVLEEGEIGYAKDLNSAKIGDGTTAWNNLDWFIKPTNLFLTADDILSIFNGTGIAAPLHDSDGTVITDENDDTVEYVLQVKSSLKEAL